MIKRVTEQEFDWVSIKDGICNETATVSIYLLGVLIRKRTLTTLHKINKTKQVDTKPGF